MTISESILPEFDREMEGTRRTLERVPDDGFDWRPHAKSSPMGDLATHLANIPTWAVRGIEQDEIDIMPGGQQLRAEPARTREEVLAAFDRNVAAARAAIAGASDERLAEPWTLLSNGRQVITVPRAAVLRNFVLNHIIHHRAQLGVYLRLNDIPVPSIYGPSADEGSL